MIGKVIILIILSSLTICCCTVTYSIGGTFDVTIDNSTTSRNPYVIITKNNDDNRVVWQSIYDSPFIFIGNGTTNKDNEPVMNGNNQLVDECTYLIAKQILSKAVYDDDSKSLLLSGFLYNNSDILISSYEFSIYSSSSERISFNISLINDISQATAVTTATTAGAAVILTSLVPIENIRVILKYYNRPDDIFVGFGEQYSYFNMKGRRLPLVVSEQGVGRDPNDKDHPLTDYLNYNISMGVGGNQFTTYSPRPIYLTSQNVSFFYDVSTITVFDFTEESSTIVEVWNVHELHIDIFVSSSLVKLMTTITDVIGRPQHQPPNWSQKGAIVALEGGEVNVTINAAKLINSRVPIAAFWLQDWVGERHNWDGTRLMWNWETNYDYYPNWDNMVSYWREMHDIRTMTYLNPFFSDPSNYSTYRHNFYAEGIDKGYFVKRCDNTPYVLQSLSIPFCMLDLTNPHAVDWMKQIISNYTMDEASSSGWMNDFGEYLPFDACLYSGESPDTYHNKYPQEWAKLTYEAVSDAGKQNDTLFFMRSSWSYSSPYTIYWLGDQLMSYDLNDGLLSALNGALSSGLSGMSLQHTDIGGYNAEYQLGNDMYYVRTPNLLKRWTEFSCFSSIIFRTHIGSSTSSVIAQVYDTNNSISHFAKFAGIFANLSDYRYELVSAAIEYGTPIVRPMMMHYSYDRNVIESVRDKKQPSQYLFGTDFLIAPSFNTDTYISNVYIPYASGKWIHLWSGNVLTPGSLPNQSLDLLQVPSPEGFPFVAYKEDSVYGQKLRDYVISNNMTSGYVWVCDDCTYDDGGGEGGDSEDHDNYFYIFLILVCVSIVVTVWICRKCIVNLCVNVCNNGNTSRMKDNAVVASIGACDDIVSPLIQK